MGHWAVYRSVQQEGALAHQDNRVSTVVDQNRQKKANQQRRVALPRQRARDLAPARFWPILNSRPNNHMYQYFNLPLLRPNDPCIMCVATMCCHMYTYPQSTCEEINFLYELLKNILSCSYYLCFENRLHQYVLQGETNKTRPHMDIF